MLTDFVSASVSGMRPNCALSKLLSGAPEIVFGDLPSTWLSFVYLPLSIAATAVTTLKVEPGGYCASVVRFSAEPSDSSCVSRASRSLFGSNDGVDAMTRIAAGLRLDRDDRAAAAVERRQRGALAAGVERRAQLVAALLLAGELVEHRLDAALLAGELVVARLLEAEAADGEERVAHRVREQRALRIAAGVRLVRAGLRPRQRRAVAGADDAARDALVLEHLALVERVLLELVLLEHRPARRPADEQREEDREEEEQADDRGVHRGALARLETASSSASSTKFATIDEPP